jgi:hypothetical protein
MNEHDRVLEHMQVHTSDDQWHAGCTYCEPRRPHLTIAGLPFVTWRQEDGTDGLVDVPTIEGRDVACLARTVDPRMIAAGLPWALTHGPNYSHESYFKTRDDAMLFVVLKARELRDVLETGNA